MHWMNIFQGIKYRYKVEHAILLFNEIGWFRLIMLYLTLKFKQISKMCVHVSIYGQMHEADDPKETLDQAYDYEAPDIIEKEVSLVWILTYN